MPAAASQELRPRRGVHSFTALVPTTLSTRHISLRAEYRGYVYKAPDFNLAGLNTDSWTHIAQPSAGIVFRF